MLFLNRRGYAPLTLCRRCGHRMACPNCTAWLVEHRARRQLACHHCGHTAPIPPTCPACDAPDSLAAIGPGVERITEEALRHFPDARILVMASDTLTGPNAAAEAARAGAARALQAALEAEFESRVIAECDRFLAASQQRVAAADFLKLRNGERAGPRRGRVASCIESNPHPSSSGGSISQTPPPNPKLLPRDGLALPGMVLPPGHRARPPRGERLAHGHA